MARHELQEISAGSMADIAFLLLIFFLVTTTMDTDAGLIRKLPPYSNEIPPIERNERDVMVVLVNRNNQLLVKGELMNLKDLRKQTKKFVANPDNDKNLPVIKYVNIPFFGEHPVTVNHVISLQTDRGTSYKMYIAVQNEIIAAYNELRDEKAEQKWNRKFDQLNKEQKEAIEEIYPMFVSEANPNIMDD